MKFFLVPIGGSQSDDAVLQTALAAASPFAGHLQFLHVRIGVGEAARNVPHVGFVRGPALRSALRDLEDESETRTKVSRQHVQEFCSRSDIELCDIPGSRQTVTASCQDEDGGALERVLFHARHSDLIVVGRSGKPNGLPSDFLERLLLECGRPVLIAGTSAPQTLTGTIMVFWRESADAARAVTAAMPLLAKATKVIFAIVTEQSEHAAATMADVVGQFAWHGVPTEVQMIAPDGRPVQDLLATAARNAEADLIVSGAYGHSRIREAVFGGCTQSLIEHADRPVLLIH